MTTLSSLLVTLAFGMQSATPATPADLSLESRSLLKCSAAFALVAEGQTSKDERAQKWPDVTVRGKEFFVRSLAQLMDETGLDRDGISALVSGQAQELLDKNAIDQAMPACLLMLEASGI